MENIPETDSDPLAKIKENLKGRSSSFSLDQVTVKQVDTIIRGLRGTTATGLNFIDVKNVRVVSKKISLCLAHIINLSIATNTFPDSYKHAKVVPLLKS